MTRRGAVGIHELWNRPESKISGFKVLFADGFNAIHKGGLATLSKELLAAHGRVMKAIPQAEEVLAMKKVI